MSLTVGYVFIAIAVIVAFLIGFYIVMRLKDSYEKETVTTLLTVLALGLSLLVLLVVPIDVYSSNYVGNETDVGNVGTDPTNTLSEMIRYFYYGNSPQFQPKFHPPFSFH